MDSTHVASPDVTDYAGLVRRHWWVVAALLLVGLGGGAGVVRTAERVYQSTTSVLVQPTGGQDANVVGGRTKGDINLDTEAQLVRSTAVAADAAALLRVTTPPGDLIRDLKVEVPPNTAVLQIRYSAGTPEAARAGSHAFAEAYLHNRGESAKGDLVAQMTALDAKIKQFGGQLAAVNRRLDTLLEKSSERSTLQSQRATLVGQINTLTGRVNALATITITPGRIISDAALPTEPVRPQPALYLGSGAMVGTLLGVLVAFVRERFGRRVRTAAEVGRRASVPVLAELGAGAAPYADDLCPPHTHAGRTFHRLRNEVIASLRPEDHILVVTGAAPGSGATIVAANLAAALARAGNDVILVGAHAPELGAPAVPVSRLLEVADAPGLTDVLSGRCPLPAAIQRAARTPRLRVLTVGGTGSAAGLLQSEGVRAALAALSQETDYVVVEAPSTASGPDAQSLAGMAHAAIVVVETRQTRHVQVIDAAEQLRRVGTPLLGSVVLPRKRAATPGAKPVGAPAGATIHLSPLRAITASAEEPPHDGVVEAVIVEDLPPRPRLAGDRPSPGRTSAPSTEDSTEVLAKLTDDRLAALDLAKAEGRPVEQMSTKDTEPPAAEPTKTEPTKTEPVKAEPVKAEPVKAEPVKAEPESVDDAEPVDTEVVSDSAVAGGR